MRDDVIDNSIANSSLILLHESEYMVRRTFALFAKQGGFAEVIETSGYNNALSKCYKHSFNVAIIGFESWVNEKKLIEIIRMGATKSAPDIPIIALLPNATTGQLFELKSMEVNEVLLKPVRVRSIQEAFLAHNKIINHI
ncbi:MAG: hypothetical protein CTY12_04045 [Methylotenera sp.]|jgi:CheY-like chemotaxis protein|nr:MAG: hypothetical protein CTY12_04045 [Methylotenera sp.]